MSTIFRLLPYDNYSVSIPKDKLLALFPTGLIATILDLDPTAEEIDIQTKIITPEILNWIQKMIVEGRIPDPIPDNLNKAGDYLQLDLFQVVADPDYPDFRQTYPDINLLDTSILNNPEIYNPVLQYALIHHYFPLLNYLFTYSTPVDHQEEDTRGVSLAILFNDMYGLKRLLETRNAEYHGFPVDLTKCNFDIPNRSVVNDTAYNNTNPSLVYAIAMGNWEMVKYLLSYLPEITSSDYEGWFDLIRSIDRYEIADKLIEGINTQEQAKIALLELSEGPPELIQKIVNSDYMTKYDILDVINQYINTRQNQDIGLLIHFLTAVKDGSEVPQWYRDYIELMKCIRVDDLECITNYFPSEAYPRLYDNVSSSDLPIPLLHVAIEYKSLQAFKYLIDELYTVPIRVRSDLVSRMIKVNNPEMLDIFLEKYKYGLDLYNIYHYAQDHELTDIMAVVEKYR